MKPKSISNRKLTLLRKLNQKKHRWKEQLFLAEGARAVEQIIYNERLQIKELFFDEQQHYWEQQIWKQIMQTIDSSVVSKIEFSAVSDTANPQGVMALCRMPEQTDLTELEHGTGVIVASDAVQDPGNMGTIIRTASWFGANGFLSGKGSVDLFHPKVVRATAGSTGAIPFTNVDLRDSLKLFEEQGWQTLLLDAGDASVPLKEVEKRSKMIIVVGNEAHGIDESIITSERKKVRIGSAGNKGVESLNAAVAASIALFELNG